MSDPGAPGEPEPIHTFEDRLEGMAHKLRALESNLAGTRESADRTRERFIDALESLDARFSARQQATAQRTEQLILSLTGAVEELKIQSRSEAERNDQTLWEGVGRLEAKVARIEQGGVQTLERLARAVATLTVAAEEWRAAAPGIAQGHTRQMQDALDGLEEAAGWSRQDLAEQLGRSMAALADSVEAWKEQIVHTTARSDEAIQTGLIALESRLRNQAHETLAAGIGTLAAEFVDQMRDLETRIKQRQEALVRLIVGGGPASGVGPGEPPAGKG